MYIRLLLIASIALMANQIILAQSLKIEYPEYTTDIAIQGNTLWQATSNSLYKSDLVTGQMLKEISYPLGYNNPFGMTTDHNNNLWFFSPYYGVARYDRQGNWQVWDSLNTPIFKGFFLNNIAFDPSSNRIFLLAPGNYKTPDKGFVFDGNSWQEDPHTNGITGGYGTSSLYEGGQHGKLIYAVSDSLMYRDQGKWIGIKKIGKNVYAQSIAFDTSGALWVMTYGDYNRLFRYDNINSNPTYVEKTKIEITHMHFDQNNNHWLATQKNGLLQRMPDKTYKTYPNTFFGYDKTVPIKKIWSDTLGRLWLAQNFDFLFTITLWQDGSPVQNLINKSPQFGITGIDRDGNLWIGGNSRLLTRRKRLSDSYEHYPLYPLFNQATFFFPAVIKQGKGDEMWLLGKQNNTFLHFNGTSWENHFAPGTNGYNTLQNDANGNIYFSSSSGISQYDPIMKQWNSLEIKAFGDNIAVVGGYDFDAQNQLWFVAEEGLGMRKTDGTVAVFFPPFQFKSYPEVELKVSPNGNIYLTLVKQNDNSGYLYEFDPVNYLWKEIDLPEKWASFAIRRDTYNYEWHIDKKGRIWLTYKDDTTYKVWYYESGNWKNIIGLPNSFPDHFVSDLDNNVYLDYRYVFATISFNSSNTSKHLESAAFTPLHLSPNPASESFWVKIPESSQGRLTLQDMQGRVVREQMVKTDQNNGFLVERMGLSAGLYVVLFKQENGHLSIGKVVLD